MRWTAAGLAGFSGPGNTSFDAIPRGPEDPPILGEDLRAADSTETGASICRWHRINDAVGNYGGVNVVSVSLLFPFGREPAPLPPPAPAPAPAPGVAIAPLVLEPAPGTLRRVSFSADSLFTFDRSGIRPEGKTALDTFASELKGARFDVINVERHTDRLGTKAYNQKLSLRRTEAVMAYLVNVGGSHQARRLQGQHTEREADRLPAARSPRRSGGRRNAPTVIERAEPRLWPARLNRVRSDATRVASEGARQRMAEAGPARL